jgi:O-antigen/teichoic acid export membrane protein
LKSSFYNAIGGVIRLSVSAFSIPILIRVLGVEEYGVWTLASSVIAVVMLAESGLSFSTTFFVSQSLAKKDVEELSQILTIVFTVIFITATLVSCLVWLGVSPILSVFPRLTSSQIFIAESSLRLGAFVVWSRLIQQVLIGVEQAYQRYGWINFLGSTQALFVNCGMILIAFNGGRSIELMKWQSVISILFLTLHCYVVMLMTSNMRLRLSWSYVKFLDVLKYSISTWISSFGGVLFSQFDRLIVGVMLGAEALGIYSAIINTTVQINTLSAIPIQPIVPILSRLPEESDDSNTKVRVIAKKSFETNCVVAFILGMIFLTFDSPIVSFLLNGKMVLNHINEFRYATIIYVLYSMNAIGYYIAFGTNSISTCMSIQILGGISSLSLMYFSIQHFGLTGAILGNAGYCLTLLLTVFGFRKLDIKWREWSSWILIPTSVFSVFCVLLSLFQDNSLIRILIFISCMLSLILWFAYCNARFLRIPALYCNR